MDSIQRSSAVRVPQTPKRRGYNGSETTPRLYMRVIYAVMADPATARSHPGLANLSHEKAAKSDGKKKK